MSITLNHICIIKSNKAADYYGIATDGYFASSAFIESDERYNEISGSTFGWYDPEDERDYTCAKHKVRRPANSEEYIFAITEILKHLEDVEEDVEDDDDYKKGLTELLETLSK